MSELVGLGIDAHAMMAGLTGAYERFERARLGTDPVQAYAPLFETLAWIASLQERLPPMYRDGDPVLRAIRFARHSVHHQWSEALVLDPTGAAFPISFPQTFFEWRWRPELLEPRNDTGKSDYLERLAGRPVRVGLAEAVLLLQRGVVSGLSKP